VGLGYEHRCRGRLNAGQVHVQLHRQSGLASSSRPHLHMRIHGNGGQVERHFGAPGNVREGVGETGGVAGGKELLRVGGSGSLAPAQIPGLGQF
jgi:hypothetical protein